MALFDMFKGAAPLEITPRRALVISLIYCMGADGEIDPEEVGHLISVLGRNATREELDRCFEACAEHAGGEVPPGSGTQARRCPTSVYTVEHDRQRHGGRRGRTGGT